MQLHPTKHRQRRESCAPRFALAFSWLLRKGKKFKGRPLKKKGFDTIIQQFVHDVSYAILEKQEDEELIGKASLWG
jgi:hypothetical protein